MAKLNLVDGWKSSWRWWSMRLNAVASIAVAYVLSSPDILVQTLNSLPPEMRAVFPPMMAFVLFGVVAGVRLWKQGHPDNG